MGTTRQDIAEWFDRGLKENAAFMIVACDTFDHEDYPVFVKPGEDLDKQIIFYSNPNQMSRVMEVYDLTGSKDEQVNSGRVWNLTNKNPPVVKKAVAKKKSNAKARSSKKQNLLLFNVGIRAL